MSSREELRAKRLKSFVHLWKIDDPKWVKQRKLEWKVIKKNYFKKGTPAKDLPVLAKFYISGQLDGYIDSSFVYIFTPCDSANTSRLLFDSDLFGSEERRNIYSSYLSLVSQMCRAESWQQYRTNWFLQGVFGRYYKQITEGAEGDPDPSYVKEISPPPTFWVGSYYGSIINLLENRIEYHANLLVMDYFVSCLGVIEDPADRAEVDLDVFFSYVEEIIGEEELSEYSKMWLKEFNERKPEIREAWAKNKSGP